MIGKLFGLIGKVIGMALLARMVGALALAGYFYYKSGQKYCWMKWVYGCYHLQKAQEKYVILLKIED